VRCAPPPPTSDRKEAVPFKVPPGFVAERVAGELPGPPYELADAFQLAIDAGETIAAVEIGKTRDLTDPLDLVEENFPYLR